MEIANVKSSAVKAIDSATSEQTSHALPRPASPRAAETPLDPSRVTTSSLQAFCSKFYHPGPEYTTRTFLYSQPGVLIKAAQENDLDLLNYLLDVSFLTQNENDLLHRIAELKEYISNNPVGGNVFLALAKNRWPEAHLATADHKKTWTADQWLTFLEDIKDTLAFDYTSFNVRDISSDNWEEITKDWDLEEKMHVFNQLIHLSSIQPSNPLSRECAKDHAQMLLAQMKENAEIRKQIVTGFFKDDVDVDHFCNFLSALERLHNQENHSYKIDYTAKEDLNIIHNSFRPYIFFLATHPLASYFGNYFEANVWIEDGELSPQWFSLLLILAEHNHGKLVLKLVKSIAITDEDSWTLLLEAASRTVEVGELAALAEKAVPGINPELIQSCKDSAEELQTMNAHEWECCAKTKTGHIFRPNYNVLTESYNSFEFENKAFPAFVPSLRSFQPNSKPFELDFKDIPPLHPSSGVIIDSIGLCISYPAQFSLPDPSTLEAILRGKSRHLRIHHFPTDYTSERAKKSFPLLLIKLFDGKADDRAFNEFSLKYDVVISPKKERIHDSFLHLAVIFEDLTPENKYVEYRNQRRDLTQKALTLIDEATLGDEMRNQLLTVLGAINDTWGTTPHFKPHFKSSLMHILTLPVWHRYFKKEYEGFDLKKLREEALRVFAPLL